uniref:Uncharacterized protein n=1 Tax=Ciona savignyi TaxID=51511 RepID=H2YP67_CIOSA
MKSCPNKDGTLTLNEFLATATKPKRRRKLNNPKSEDEELIQVAKALSKSEIEVEKAKKKMARAKKKEIPIPAMLEMSMQSRKAALDARAAQLVMTVGSETGNKSEEDTEVSSTPVLPTPKWKSVKTAGNTEVSDNLDPFQMNDIPDAKLQVPSDAEDRGIDAKAEDGNDQVFKVPKTLTSPQLGKTSKFSNP